MKSPADFLVLRVFYVLSEYCKTSLLATQCYNCFLDYSIDLS